MTRRSALLALALAACVALVSAMPAAASPRKPKISRVTPMRVVVGAKLVVRGRRFSPRRRRNTLIFRGPNGRVVFVKPKRATRRRLVVVLPSSIRWLLRVSNGQRRATRIKIRATVGRRFGRWTTGLTSPVVVPRAADIVSTGDAPPGTGTGTGGSSAPTSTPCGTGSDYDGDLLSNGLEAALGTDPCLKDTDADGVEDGYEEQSAIDLNQYPATPPLPYPGKRPYPNPLDPTDAGTDYDGDGLSQSSEYLAWIRYAADGVKRSGRPTTLANLLYSDGMQQSISPPPAAPNSGSDPLGNWALDWSENGTLSDNERDADGDALGNWDEQGGKLTEGWWVKQHDGTNEPKESKYPGINFLDNGDLPKHDAMADPDIDGDAVLDGADDSDHDGLSNEFEVRRPSNWLAQAWTVTFDPGPNSWAYVQPFNPCKPFRSERCHLVIPFGYYDSDEVPPVGPTPPAGYPASHPDTPNG